MRPVKSFEEYRKELHESRMVAEGIIDSVKKFIKKVGDFFKGPGADWFNVLLSQNKKQTKKGITYYPSKEDLEFLKSEGVNLAPVKAKNESVTFDHYLEEDKPIQEMAGDTDIVKQHHDDLVNVGSEELMDFIRATIEAEDDSEPLVIWGPPGIGKTAIVNAVTKEYGKRLIDYDLMTMAPEDFFLPTLTGRDEKGEASKSTRLPDEFLPLYKEGDEEGHKVANGPDGKGGVIFFDEMARCNPRVQNVCLKILNERRVGSWILGSKWVVVAACNREADEPDSNTFAWTATLSNRAKMVNFVAQFSEWEKWANDARDSKGRVLIAPEIMAFLRFFHDKYFYRLNPTKKEAAWPSPRSWTKASKTYTQMKSMKEAKGQKLTDKDVKNILGSTVGKEAADAFAGFVALIEKINPEDVKSVYKDPSKAPGWKGLKIDEVHALIAAVAMAKADDDHAKNTLSEKEMDNFTQWLIDQKGQFPGAAQMAVKAISVLYDYHGGHDKTNPDNLKFNRHWEEECKGRLFDVYSNLSDTKE